jgi:hypothetical protein
MPKFQHQSPSPATPGDWHQEPLTSVYGVWEFGEFGTERRARSGQPGLWISLWIMGTNGSLGSLGSLTRGLTDMTTMPLISI